MAARRLKRERLGEAIDRAISKWCEEPFDWARNNCVLSIADIILDAEGYDPAEPSFRNRKFKTMAGAMRAAAKAGGFVALVERAADRHGWREIHPSEALLGDIGLISPRIFLVKHHSLWVQRLETCGFGAEPTGAISRAWRI